MSDRRIWQKLYKHFVFMSFYSLSGQQVSQKNYYFSAMQSSSTLVSLLSFLAVVLKKYVVLKIFLKHCVFEFRLGDVCLRPKYKILCSKDYFLFGFKKVNIIQNLLENLFSFLLILCYLIFQIIFIIIWSSLLFIWENFLLSLASIHGIHFTHLKVFILFPLYFRHIVI